MNSKKDLEITKASENNLKQVSLDIPHDSFCVVTGLSGSGKSSLAFDTVYAEGQRRYIETFSPYTRQFFDKVKKPDVESISNVRPAIAIQQRTRITSARSTVGSLTNILDYLKIFWSNLAQPYCPSCQVALESWKPEALSERLRSIIALKSRARFLLCAPVSFEKQSLKGELLRLSTLGFNRIYRESDGLTLELEDCRPGDLEGEVRLLVVLDRFIGGKAPARNSLLDTIEQAYSLSSGVCILIEQNPDKTSRPWLRIYNNETSENRNAVRDSINEFRSSYSCHAREISIDRPTPALFSFNHPLGACPECKGFGRILQIDPLLCIADPGLTIKQKAITCWAGDAAGGVYRKLLKFCEQKKIPVNIPWSKLSEEDKNLIFNSKTREYRGIFDWFKKLEKKSYKMHVRVFLSRYRKQVVCPSCHGTRLRPSALAYRIGGKTLPDILELTIDKTLTFFISLRSQLEEEGRLTREVDYVLQALLARLQCLVNLGLPYLTLNRQARTLSGGETQRVNLATAVGSELISAQFVLDEPSVGLHARDTTRLINTLRELQTKNNSLLVVEHDPECIAAADHIIELGPKAGAEGGEIVFNDAAGKWPQLKFDQSLINRNKLKPAVSERLLIRSASARNLKSVSLEVPLKKLVAVTGVSGSGKSSLVNEVIKNAYEQWKSGAEQSNTGQVSGFDSITELLVVDQSPLSKTPRANIATYTKIWDEIRTLLASTEAAKTRAVNKSSFSFNVDGGRCPVCKGAGHIREDMQFLSDVYVPCETCLGKRFQEKVLEVRYKGYNAFEFLQLSVAQAGSILNDNKHIVEASQLLAKLGLGHLTLGHALSELSGGEAQRLKLVPVLQQASSTSSLLIFDEPTTGLHLRDVENLIILLRLLVEKGHSIICVEHNLALIAASDWIIDLGPEGGELGGEVVACGAPTDILKARNSYTASALREFLAPAKPAKESRRKVAALSKKAKKTLNIAGAREHNLKNLDISLPLNQVIALTGVSGSGKSTIAKDIIYSEGQRRFLDCLSPYARQFIKELKRPDIEHIDNVMPTICVYQHTFQPSRLSTVATMCEVYSHLRLMYSKIGIQYCPDHPDMQITPRSFQEISAQIKALRTPVLRIMAPIVKMKKGHHNEVLKRAMESEITEVRADGLFGSPGKFIDALDRRKVHSVDYVVAKFNPQNMAADLIEEAVKQAFSLAAGNLILHSANKEEIISLERACPVCRRGFYKPDPEDLSFNSRRGVCLSCEGSGKAKGSKDERPCPVCEGARLNALGRNIRINGKSIHEACLMNATELKDFLSNLKLGQREARISDALFSETLSKLQTLTDIGLDYLSLDRDCSSLSSGELQRLRLASAVGSPLSGVMYIFDEPSAGLHPFDNAKVIERLTGLKEQGNSVIVIEHDANNILAADYVLDIGPGGGKDGGQVVFSGKIADFLDDTRSQTALAISESLKKQVPQAHQEKRSGGSLHIEKAQKNNLKIRKLDIPLGCLVSIMGVSGAGKSSLLHGVIADGLTLGKGKANKSWIYGESKISSDLEISNVLFIDQKPIGINSRSTPASYLGVWDEIRKVFASTIEAKARGWKQNHFSYNTGNGRCPDCKGQGQIKLEMNFLPDAAVLCETCGGSRFREETNRIHYQGYSISDVLNLTFEEAKSVFANHRKIYHTLHLACEIGLGYLTLGQSSPTLSGGESQRIKLVSELSSNKRGHTIYILDEPTTGLHKRDVARLLKILHSLIGKGNSVMLIEHDEDVILGSDYLIELGPGPGDEGGNVIFEGPPADLFKADTPWSRVLNRSARDAA